MVVKIKRPRKPVTTVVFDLSAVLIDFWTGLVNSLTTVVPQSPAVIAEQLHNPAWNELLRGQIFEDEYWNRVIKANRWNLALEVPKRLARQSFREIDGVRPHILDLRRRGYNLMLLSNHAREWVDYLNRQFGHEKLFDHVIYSCDVGMLKPERAIYLHALKRLGTDPESILFIDDQAINLRAAEELGIKTLHFVTADQLGRDLAGVLS